MWYGSLCRTTDPRPITHPTFGGQSYQAFLVYVAVTAFGVLSNTVLFKGYTFALRWMIVYLTGSGLIYMVVLLVQATPKQSAHTVFVEFVNVTGWSSDGLVFLMGLLPGITAITCIDSATHVTDEVPDPARQVPQVMIGTAVLAGLSGLPMTIVYMFCVTNQENLLTPVGSQPFAQLIRDACRSEALTVFLMVLLIILYLVASTTLFTTLSRIVWSLAEIKHIIFSPWLEKVDTLNHVPANAIYATAVLACLFGLLCLGPATALNAIIGSGSTCLYISFMIPLICALCNRTKLSSNTTARRYINLGKFGHSVNCIAMAWMVLMSTVLMFPQYLPPTIAYMNYTVAVLAGVFVVYTTNCFLYARTRYQPKMTRSARIPPPQNDRV